MNSDTNFKSMSFHLFSTKESFSNNEQDSTANLYEGAMIFTMMQ